MSVKTIADLDTFSGTPGNSDFLAVENETGAYKVPASEIKGRTYTGAYGIAVNENQISLDVRGLSTDSRQSTDPTDVFPFQTSGGSVYKVMLGSLIGNLLSHVRNGTGINIQWGSDSSGPYITLSGSGGASYTAGDGIDITSGAISVKLGNNLSINPETGNIDASGNGTAATIEIGTVTTGAAGTNASVTNSGTSSAAVFDFVIPRGADGSGGGSYSETELYSGTTRQTTMTLSQSMQNFDALIFKGEWIYSTYNYEYDTIVPVSALNDGNRILTGATTRYQFVMKDSDTTIALPTESGTWDNTVIITKIIGITYN